MNSQLGCSITQPRLHLFDISLLGYTFAFLDLKVKRAAMAELQRAVAMAERRAIESVAVEKIKMERMIVESATAAAAMAASQAAATTATAAPATASTSSSSPEAKAAATSGNGKQHSPLKKQDLFGRGNVAATAAVQEHVRKRCRNFEILDPPLLSYVIYFSHFSASL